jgi:uncharacterized membrane-anchored protein YitT (DUF2179 family)
MRDYFIGGIILTIISFVFVKYLQYKHQVGILKLFLLVILLNIIFYGFYEIKTMIYDDNIKNEFADIQLNDSDLMMKK